MGHALISIHIIIHMFRSMVLSFFLSRSKLQFAVVLLKCLATLTCSVYTLFCFSIILFVGLMWCWFFFLFYFEGTKALPDYLVYVCPHFSFCPVPFFFCKHPIWCVFLFQMVRFYTVIFQVFFGSIGHVLYSDKFSY